MSVSWELPVFVKEPVPFRRPTVVAELPVFSDASIGGTDEILREGEAGSIQSAAVEGDVATAQRALAGLEEAGLQSGAAGVGVARAAEREGAGA